jgi:uroporphyrinogen-III synthase
MRNALHDRRVALAEGRQLEELAQLLESEGAIPLRCPMLSILDNADAGPVHAWLGDLAADRFSHVVLMTGEALRRLLAFAERGGHRDAVIAALGRTCTVTRGPKPVRALKEIGLAPGLVAPTPTTAGVIAALGGEPLRGRYIGVTLYGEPNPALVHFLEEAGAEPRTVMPYVYALAADAGRVADLITELDRGTVDVLIFTSSPQVDRLFEVAAQRDLVPTLDRGLGRTRVAAVGPVVAQTLRERGVEPAVCPEQGFVMKNLVQHIKRALGGDSGEPVRT